MKDVLLTVRENKQIADRTYLMRLCGDVSDITKPGQFVNIALNGFFLRRPISVCDCENNTLTIIYKTVGGGTEYMSRIEKNATLDVLVGLGNGYDTKTSGVAPVLIGGGVGVPPLYMLAKKLKAEGKRPEAVLGFNSRDEMFFKKEFQMIGVPVTIATVDGSYGVKGFVTDALRGIDYTYFYTCGPEAMLKAVYYSTATDGQFSFEERMGCGFGGCMGCTCKTKYGSKRICLDGPVLFKEEIIW
jgi:dihydroorotate dehydrogenase electron transfer subunit